PDVLLARAVAERVGDRVRPLDDERRRALLATVDRLADRALRTLAVAYRPLDGDAADVDADAERDLILLGLVGMLDPPRAGARDAIAEATGAGVRLVMITGDHPRTAARIAHDLGIADGASAVLTGTEIDALDEAGLRGAL